MLIDTVFNYIYHKCILYNKNFDKETGLYYNRKEERFSRSGNRNIDVVGTTGKSEEVGTSKDEVDNDITFTDLMYVFHFGAFYLSSDTLIASSDLSNPFINKVIPLSIYKEIYNYMVDNNLLVSEFEMLKYIYPKLNNKDIELKDVEMNEVEMNEIDRKDDIPENAIVNLNDKSDIPGKIDNKSLITFITSEYNNDIKFDSDEQLYRSNSYTLDELLKIAYFAPTVSGSSNEWIEWCINTFPTRTPTALRYKYRLLRKDDDYKDIISKLELEYNNKKNGGKAKLLKDKSERFYGDKNTTAVEDKFFGENYTDEQAHRILEMGNKYLVTDPEWIEFCKIEFPHRTITAIGYKYRRLIRKQKELQNKDDILSMDYEESCPPKLAPKIKLDAAQQKTLNSVLFNMKNSSLETTVVDPNKMSMVDANYTDDEIDLVMKGGNKYKFGTQEFEDFCSLHFPMRTSTAINSKYKKTIAKMRQAGLKVPLPEWADEVSFKRLNRNSTDSVEDDKRIVINYTNEEVLEILNFSSTCSLSSKKWLDFCAQKFPTRSEHAIRVKLYFIKRLIREGKLLHICKPEDIDRYNFIKPESINPVSSKTESIGSNIILKNLPINQYTDEDCLEILKVSSKCSFSSDEWVNFCSTKFPTRSELAIRSKLSHMKKDIRDGKLMNICTPEDLSKYLYKSESSEKHVPYTDEQCLEILKFSSTCSFSSNEWSEFCSSKFPLRTENNVRAKLKNIKKDIREGKLMNICKPEDLHKYEYTSNEPVIKKERVRKYWTVEVDEDSLIVHMRKASRPKKIKTGIAEGDASPVILDSPSLISNSASIGFSNLDNSEDFINETVSKLVLNFVAPNCLSNLSDMKDPLHKDSLILKLPKNHISPKSTKLPFTPEVNNNNKRAIEDDSSTFEFSEIQSNQIYQFGLTNKDPDWKEFANLYFPNIHWRTIRLKFMSIKSNKDIKQYEDDLKEAKFQNSLKRSAEQYSDPNKRKRKPTEKNFDSFMKSN